jgi:hypothetical protein
MKAAHTHCGQIHKQGMASLLCLCLSLCLALSCALLRSPFHRLSALWSSRFASSPLSARSPPPPPGYDPRPLGEDYDDPSPVDVLQIYQTYTGYRPQMGLESIVTSAGESRPLFPTEYIAAFQLFPGLRNASLTKIWPSERSLEGWEQQVLDNIKEERHEKEADLELVMAELNTCRNNPGVFIKQLNQILHLCIIKQDQRTEAVKVLEYTGIDIFKFLPSASRDNDTPADFPPFLDLDFVFNTIISILLGKVEVSADATSGENVEEWRMQDLLLQIYVLCVRLHFSQLGMDRLLLRPPSVRRRLRPSSLGLRLVALSLPQVLQIKDVHVAGMGDDDDEVDWVMLIRRLN